MNRLVTFLFLFTFPVRGIAEDPTPTFYDYPWSVSASIGAYEDRFSAGGSILSPIWHEGNELVFLNSYTAGDEGGREYFSLGLGYRKLNADDSIFGFGFYYDRAQLDSGVHFDRFGVNVERLSDAFDVHFNGYFASNESYVTGGVASYGSLFAQNHSIFQNLIVGGSEAYDGVELEVGRRLQLPDTIPFWVEVYAGAYGYFSPDDESFYGYKGGVEVGLNEFLSLEAVYYDDEELLGAHSYVGLKAAFTVDTSGDRLKFAGVRSAPRGSKEATRLRMVEPVKREHRIYHSETVKAEELVATDIVFVNNGADAGNGIGKARAGSVGLAQNPYRTVQQGADRAAAKNRRTGRVWTVYTQGGVKSPDYVDDVKIRESMRFTSSAIRIHGDGGQFFGTDDPVTLEGGFQAANVDLVGIEGYSILNGTSSVLSGATDQSTLDPGNDRGRGEGIYLEGVKDITISMNQIVGARNNGLTIIGKNGRNSSLKISDNEFQFNGGYGIGLLARPGWRGSGNFTGNKIENSGDDGFHIEGPGASFAGNVRGNRFLENGDDGFHLDLMSNFTGRIAGNVSNRNEDDGFDIDVGVGFSFDGALVNNTARGNDEEGLVVQTVGASWKGDIKGNNFSGNDGDGVWIEAFVTDWDGNILGNRTSNNEFTGMFLDFFGADFTSRVDRNVANGNRIDGIEFLLEDGELEAGASFSNNVANDNGFHGLHIELFNDKVDDGVSIDGNRANGNEIGILFLVDGDFEGSTFNGNVANGNDLGGIVVDLLGNDFQDGSSFSNNITNNNGLFGIGSDLNEDPGIIDSGNIQSGNGVGPRDPLGTDDLGNNISNN